MVHRIFIKKQATDIFVAPRMVSERLQLVAPKLPAGVDAPIMLPITSRLGEIIRDAEDIERGTRGQGEGATRRRRTVRRVSVSPRLPPSHRASAVENLTVPFLSKEESKVKKMNFKGRLTFFGILLIAISMIAYSSRAWSQEAEKHGHPTPHGGEVRMTDKFHVELAVKDHGIEVYLLDINQKPLPVKEDMSGDVFLTFEDRTGKKLSLVKALHGGQIRRVDDIFAELVIKHEGIDIYLLDKTQKPISISADFSGSISVKFPDNPLNPPLLRGTNVKEVLEPVVEVKEHDAPHIKAPIDLSDAETFDAEVNLSLGELGKKTFKFKYKSEEHEDEEHESEHESEHQLLSHFEASIDLSKVDTLRILVSADLGKLGEKAGEKQFRLRFNYRRHKEEEHKEEPSEHHD